MSFEDEMKAEIILDIVRDTLAYGSGEFRQLIRPEMQRLVDDTHDKFCNDLGLDRRASRKVRRRRARKHRR